MGQCKINAADVLEVQITNKGRPAEMPQIEGI
jgi:hypothetical protein